MANFAIKWLPRWLKKPRTMAENLINTVYKKSHGERSSNKRCGIESASMQQKDIEFKK